MQAQPAGRTSPHLCAAIWRRRLLWAVICLVWAVTCMRGTPRRRRGRACGFNPPTCAACEVPMGSDASYNERRLLWEVGTLCLGCNLHEDSPAPAVLARRGRACRLSLRRGRACRLSLPRHTTAGDSYGKSVRPIMSGGFYGKRHAELYAGSTRPAG